MADERDIDQIALSMLLRHGRKSEGGAAWWAHEHAFGYPLNSPGQKFWLSVRDRIYQFVRVRSDKA